MLYILERETERMCACNKRESACKRVRERGESKSKREKKSKSKIIRDRGVREKESKRK